MNRSFNKIKRNEFRENGWVVQVFDMHFDLFGPMNLLLIESGSEAGK